VDAILKESHENRWLEQGWYLALQFKEGWVGFRVTGREFSELTFPLGAVAAGGNLAAWNTIIDPTNRYYLSPPDQNFIYHHFWGVTPAKARIYTQFEAGEDVGSLLDAPRGITLADGNVGFVNGNMSPFGGPYSVATELFVVYQKWPAFNVLNPLTSAMTNVQLRFQTMKYGYTLIKNQKTLQSMLTGTQKVRKYTMGRVDPSPMSIPRWLRDLVREETLKYTTSVMEAQQ